MNILLWALAALAAGALTEEILSWVTPVCIYVVRRAARRLPEGSRGRYIEEWSAHLLDIPQGPLARIVWTAGTLVGIRSIRTALVEPWPEKEEVDHSIADVALPLYTASAPAPRQPTVLRITLGAELRRLRIASGIEQHEAAWQIRSSESKMMRLESGQVDLKPRDAADLLTLYRVIDSAAIESFQRLALHANTTGWWHHSRDQLPSGLPAYVSLEASASLIRSYASNYILDLLQTADYAQALLGWRSGPTGETPTSFALQAQRREALRHRDSPRLWAVIDEAALRRPVGGVSVMVAQLEHLVEISQQPNITVQVLPLSCGGAAEEFTLFQYPHPELRNVVHLEQKTSSVYTDDPSDIDDYTALIDRLSLEALPPNRTRDILQSIRDSYASYR